MVKKVLSLAMSLLLTVSAWAQWGAVNPTISQDHIQFWTGTGSNRAVVAITWVDGEDNIGFVWGVQWNGGNLQVRDIMDTIAAYDSHLIITWNDAHDYINNLTYVEEGDSLTAPIDPFQGIAYWFYNWKDGATDTINASVSVMDDYVVSGDFVDWITMDLEDYTSQPADIMMMAADPNAPVIEEATIDPSNILYWVGEGSNEAVLAVNWANTALAWGYRFDDTKTVADMMNDIATADPRFSYTLDAYNYLDDIIFVVAPGDTLRKQVYSYWESKNNGVMDAGMAQPLMNGDFEKWAEPAAGVVISSMLWTGWWVNIYNYPMEILPVSVATGIANVEMTVESIWPNPTTSFVNVSVNRAAQAVLYDFSGRCLAVYNLSEGNNTLDFSRFATGVYMLRVDNSVSKIVKK